MGEGWGRRGQWEMPEHLRRFGIPEPFRRFVEGDWETSAVATATREEAVCGDGAAEHWCRSLAGEAEPDATAAAPSPVSNGRTVSFEELARLVRRPKPRRRPAPEGQLRLFVAKADW